MKKIYHANIHQNKVGVGIFILDKVDIRPRTIIRYRKTHYTMIRESAFQEDSNSKCVRTQQWRNIHEAKPLKRKEDTAKSTLVLGDLSTPFPATDRPGQKISTRTEPSTIHQQDLTYICRAPAPGNSRTHSFQGPTGHISRDAISWAIKQALAN